MTSRRAFFGLLAGLPLAACQSTQMAAVPPQQAADSDYDRWYIGTVKDEPHDYYLVDRRLMKPELARQVVPYKGDQRAGTIIVDIDERFLYLVQDDGTAVRYGVGVGRQGFSWRGVARVGRKGKWPTWNPTTTMVSLKIASSGTRDAGIDNPLGARALYLYQGNRDTLFRIHGTNEPWSIGEQVSSGCVRMLNEDIVDLYERVPVGATVLVRRNGRWRV
ncbi:L,D-transpeptidase [Enterovirga sp. CN4-39]|uniref:L,D-transpeptidase n=1 Tax=Enterovirga sp. CN4-39 TaxID=3400910 RepID=UPI003C050E11